MRLVLYGSGCVKIYATLNIPEESWSKQEGLNFVMQLNIDQKLKERLVGMAVLLFIGVIIIPWVLDGEEPEQSKANNRQATELSLPSPEGLRTHDINLQDGGIKQVSIAKPELAAKHNSQSKLPDTGNSKKSSDEKDLKSINSNSTQTVAAIAESGATSNRQSQASENAKTETTKPASRSEKSFALKSDTSVDAKPNVREEAMREQVMTDPVSTWTVQLGSFGDKANAERQVKQLTDKGFPAFLSRYQNSAGKVLYRVRVGTEKDRARADKLLARLANSGFNGKVLTHP